MKTLRFFIIALIALGIFSVFGKDVEAACGGGIGCGHWGNNNGALVCINDVSVLCSTCSADDGYECCNGGCYPDPAPGPGGPGPGGPGPGPNPGPPPPAACTSSLGVSCPPGNSSGGGGCCSPHFCSGGICRTCAPADQFPNQGIYGGCCTGLSVAINGSCKPCVTVGEPYNLSPNGDIVHPGPVTLSWGSAWGANGGYSVAVGFPVYGYVAGARSATINVPDSWMGSTIGWAVSAANACGTSSNSSSATFSVCKADGAICSGQGSACCSGFCMGGRCGGRVISPTPPCSGPPRDIGESCGGSGACCASGHCSSPSGGTCCKPNGMTCQGNGGGCCSGIGSCINGTCGGDPTPTPTPACPGGLKVDGMPCGGSGACCVSGACIPNRVCGGSSSCKRGGESCGGSGAACCSGQCIADGSGACSGSSTCKLGGETCTGGGGGCCSGSCISGRCGGSSSCKRGGESCGGSGAACCSGQCIADGSGACSGSSTCKLGGESCGGSGAACCSGSCVTDGTGVCGTAPTSTPTSIPTTPTPTQPPGYTPPPVTDTPTPTNDAWIQLQDASFQGSGTAINPIPTGRAFITNEKGIVAGEINLEGGDAGGPRIITNSIGVDTESYPAQASARKRPKLIATASEITGTDKIYIVKDPGRTIDTAAIPAAASSKSFVVINKSGTVEINSNYNSSGGAKLIIAEEIDIAAGVTQIDAILVADIIKFGGGTDQLVINGNLAVNGIEDARVGTSYAPGVSVNVKPQMYIDLLPQLSVLKVNWKKVD